MQPQSAEWRILHFLNVALSCEYISKHEVFCLLLRERYDLGIVNLVNENRKSADIFVVVENHFLRVCFQKFALERGFEVGRIVAEKPFVDFVAISD